MGEFKEPIFSAEQIDQNEKFLELSDMMSKLSESLNEQKEADEITDLIDSFKKECKNQDIDLNKYMFGEIIVSPNSVSSEPSHYQDYDTPKHDIEKFITDIFEKVTMTPEKILMSKEGENEINEQDQQIAA